jgi:hypothetical protein
MVPLGTTGTGANHAFNTLPGDPSLARIAPPDQAAKIDRELVQPGREIAARELPADQAAKIFETQITALANGWGKGERDVLVAALDRRPTAPMTMKDLDALIARETAAFRDANAAARTETWKKTQAAAGKPPAQAEVDTYLADMKKKVDDWLTEERGEALANAVPLPQVVIADTNWGDATKQLYFVIAPDPRTGELAMFEKDIFTGKLTPKGPNWTNAQFDTVR